jgi:hypothetical protein
VVGAWPASAATCQAHQRCCMCCQPTA